MKIKHVKTRGDGGFTLLELLVVLFLVSLILGISAFYFSASLSAGRFNSAVRDVSSAIRNTRNLARTGGEERVLVIDMNEKSYGPEGGARSFLPPGVSVRVVDGVAGEAAEGVYRFVFRPRGAAGGGDIILSGGKRTAAIRMDPIVGAVKVK